MLGASLSVSQNGAMHAVAPDVETLQMSANRHRALCPAGRVPNIRRRTDRDRGVCTRDSSADDRDQEPGSEHAMERRDFLALLGLGAAGAGIAACSSPKGAAPPPPRHTSSTFPIGAAARAKSKPVQIAMWHSMTSANLHVLTAMTDTFNATQHDVRVSLVNQDSYAATLAAYTKALSSGTPPDIVQMDSSYLQILVDSHAMVPVQDAIDADDFDLADFVPSPTESFRVGSSVWAMPFNCSAQLLYYDKKAFSRAGLNPDSPPGNTSELRAAAEAIVRHSSEKFGLSFKLTSSSLYQWMALGGQNVVNLGNGHDGRATAVTFDGAGGSAVFDWLSQAFKDKLAQAVPSGSFDNLLAIGNQSAPMTLDTSASLGSINQVLARGHYKDVELAVAPTPLALPVRPPAVRRRSSADFISCTRSSAARLDGAWQYVKYLVDAASQASWAAQTGSVPVRKSATKAPAVIQSWDATPGYRVAYEQIASSPGTAASSGPLTGAADSVTDTIQVAMAALASGSGASARLTGPSTPATRRWRTTTSVSSSRRHRCSENHVPADRGDLQLGGGVGHHAELLGFSGRDAHIRVFTGGDPDEDLAAVRRSSAPSECCW